MASGNVVPIAIGSEAIAEGFSEKDLGRGFKLNIAPGESPFKSKIFKTDNRVVKSPQVKSHTFSEVMDSLDKVSEHMNIAGHLSVSYGPMISGEGAGKYLKSNVKTSRQSSLRYRTQHIHSYSHLLMDDEQARVPMDDVVESYNLGALDADVFGTLFVDQIIWGAQLDVTFTVESEEDEDLSELMAELKGEIGVGALSVGFRAKFEQREGSVDRNYKMTIKAMASGVQVNIPPNPSLEQMFKVVNDFNNNYKDLCKQEENLLEDAKQHTRLSPIAFVLRRTEDYMPNKGRMESAFLEQQMNGVADVFKSASFWIAKLTAVLNECEAEYSRPQEREKVACEHAQQVQVEISKLKAKQSECLKYRQLPLRSLLGRGDEEVTPVPTGYPPESSKNRLEGLLGNGFISSPVTFEGGIGEVAYDYEGFLVEGDDGALKPCLSGRLLEGGQEVAFGRTPEMLAGMVHIKNHKFNPELLRTSIPAVDDFDPHRGDIFVPDDMREMLDERNSNGKLVGPVFNDKKMVLMGPMGAGKTSLFNRLTGSKESASVSLQSCTTTLSMAKARGPAKELLVCDTPGTANSDTNGMTIDEAMELRKALTRGTVSQLVVVISFPNNTRKQALSDQLAVAMNDIFDCETFKRDANGSDVTMSKANKSSPHRTRAFLVVTHRDCAMIGREKFGTLIEALRKDFPWIGPVAFIDERVSLGWLYDTIVACAGYQKECCTNHTIPLVEMFTKFKMTFKPLSTDYMDYIENAKHKLSIGMNCAIEKVTETIQKEKEVEITGSHVDQVAPTLDCVTRFIDDLYEKTTQETLAKCYGQSIDDLWSSTDENINNEKVNTMNVIKQQLASTLLTARRKVLSAYPTAGEAAVYKKCPYCCAVFTKPTGCNYIGSCGSGGWKKDEHHNGTMTLQLQYDYDSNQKKLDIRHGEAGPFEKTAWVLRRKVRDMAMSLPIYNSEYSDADPAPKLIGALRDYGCGRELRWDMMIALSARELVDNKLVPGKDPAVVYEPSQDSNTMPIESFLSLCGEAYEGYLGVFHEHGVKKVKTLVDLDEEEKQATLEEMGIKSLHIDVILGRLSSFN